LGGIALLGVASGVLLATGSGLSAMPDKASGPELTITSQTMTMQGKERQAVFEEEVVLIQGDMTIHSDRMVVTFKKGKDTGIPSSSEGSFGKQIELAVATGHVVIKKGSGKATSGRAVYHKDEEKVVLTESPVACQEGTRVTGTRMTMYLKEDRSIVEGGSRVIIENEEGACQ